MKHAGKVRTIEMAIETEAPTIGTFHREKTREFTEGLVMTWLMYLNKVLNLNKPLSEDQIEMCAIEIVNDYYMLKITDLTLLFKRIISGLYGEFYESLSVPKVLTFFREYSEERSKVGADLSLRKHQDEMSNDTFNISRNIKRIYRGAKSK